MTHVCQPTNLKLFDLSYKFYYLIPLMIPAYLEYVFFSMTLYAPLLWEWFLGCSPFKIVSDNPTLHSRWRSRHGHDHMLVQFTTTYAISVIGSVIFLLVLRIPPPLKLTCHDITEILLKVV
jgi:hypothetical protein